MIARVPLPHPRLSTHALHLCVLGAQVDCTTSPKTCKRFKVEGYPTLLVLHQGEMCVRYCFRACAVVGILFVGYLRHRTVWVCVGLCVCARLRPKSSVNDCGRDNCY